MAASGPPSRREPDFDLTDLVEVWRVPTRARAGELALVLSAVGISSEVNPTTASFSIYVAARNADRARKQIEAYERENAPYRMRRPEAPDFPVRVEATLAYCGVLLFFFAAESRHALDVAWAAAGAARADLIFGGEWWRVVTALTLHADFAHLGGNLLFGAVAGAVLAQLTGAGVAWLAIVTAGSVGNVVTAGLHFPDHVSIGASTGVFAAVGILSGHAQLGRWGRIRPGLRRWSPVAAGIMLLVFLGLGGERTDITAHVAGFAVGVSAGLGLATVPRRAVADRRVQRAAAAAAACLVGLAWAAALGT